MEQRKMELSQMTESVAIGLYQQDEQRGLGQINSLVAELLKMTKETDNTTSLNIEAMNQILLEAMKALEAKDYVLLADILFYDLKGLLADETSEYSSGVKTPNVL